MRGQDHAEGAEPSSSKGATAVTIEGRAVSLVNLSAGAGVDIVGRMVKVNSGGGGGAAARAQPASADRGQEGRLDHAGEEDRLRQDLQGSAAATAKAAPARPSRRRPDPVSLLQVR